MSSCLTLSADRPCYRGLARATQRLSSRAMAGSQDSGTPARTGRPLGAAGESLCPGPPTWGACPLIGAGSAGSGWQRQTDALRWLSSLKAPSPGQVLEREWSLSLASSALESASAPCELGLSETGPLPSLGRSGCFCPCHPSAGTPERSWQGPGRRGVLVKEGRKDRRLQGIRGSCRWASRDRAVPLPHTISPHLHSEA